MSDTSINFNDIEELGPQSYSAEFDITADDLDRDELTGSASVKIEATVRPGGAEGEYDADGNVTVTADLNCSRCLEPSPFANTSSFHVRFRPRPETAGEGNEEVEITGEEELDVEFYTGREMALRDLAVEQIQLAIPMKPLCDEGCLGLCPQCGANRNREACQCEAPVADDRWAALQGIRDQLTKKKDV